MILLVDDFVDALEMYGEYLTASGYPVITARSGEEALRAATAHDPSLILMDREMPEMSGTEVLRVLRSDDSFSNVTIVAFTAHAFADECREALSAGFDDVIVKPCLPDELVVSIERLLANGRSRNLHER